MKPEIAVLDIQGQYRIHTEHYRSESAHRTIILVNGSMSTTASFAQTLKNLHPALNVVLYDQPYAGQSKPHNPHHSLLTNELEAHVLLELIEHFNAHYVLSFSWGGLVALAALAERPQRIEKAVISSFSPAINTAMQDYLERGRHGLARGDRTLLGHLVNDTLGKHLPHLFKRFNFRHISTLADHEYAQMHFHIDHLLASDYASRLKAAERIAIPVLFINGEWDEYTAAKDARQFAHPVTNSQFAIVDNTGHFLDMEHTAASRHTKSVVLDFLNPVQSPSSAGLTMTPSGEHIGL
ncbi:alpha/beta hydrolase [Pseudomonas lundensis]|uniref:alpha/beta fold hydrolase n=1 Tax=Pseudomonas TaxID=286 RepID=UPI0006424647|nr:MULTISPECIES: alpha/beta hydrolase [Pseudomonas]NNA13425.1 alpha/beta hydrolase [Pseudomonas lundensis]